MLCAVCATSASWTWCGQANWNAFLCCSPPHRCCANAKLITCLVTCVGPDLQDHHCLFLGTCIGRRNHRHFLLVMIWAIAGCLYAAVCCACLLARRRHQVRLRSSSPGLAGNAQHEYGDAIVQYSTQAVTDLGEA